MGNAGGLVAITASFEKKQIPTPLPTFFLLYDLLCWETSESQRDFWTVALGRLFVWFCGKSKQAEFLFWEGIDQNVVGLIKAILCLSSVQGASPSFWWLVSVPGDGTEGEATCWSQPWDFYEALGQNARFWKVFNEQWKICKSVVILLVRISFPACIHGWAAGSGLCWLFRPWKEGGCGLVGGLVRPVRYRWKHGL